MPKLTVELKRVVDDTYDIEIGRNLVKSLIDDIKNGICKTASRYVIITDSNVEPLYAQSIKNELINENIRVDMISFEAGEESKTRQTKEMLEDTMIDIGCKRDCAIIAVGGGVVSDVAGFTAGTFGRGVDFLVYSTTLLSAADASVGGKTAVDTPVATNLIGLFNQPKKVYIDIDTWKTLSHRQLLCGISETIKHACLADCELFEYLENNIDKVISLDEDACNYISQKNCSIKMNVVMKDERESGLREVLNLGHTVGRAIETLSEFRLLHGEAVSIGLVAQAKLSQSLGFLDENTCQRVISLLEKSGLPVNIPDYIDISELCKKLFTDKKVRNGKLRFVLQNGVGSVCEFENGKYSTEIEIQLIEKILREMR